MATWRWKVTTIVENQFAVHPPPTRAYLPTVRHYTASAGFWW